MLAHAGVELHPQWRNMMWNEWESLLCLRRWQVTARRQFLAFYKGDTFPPSKDYCFWLLSSAAEKVRFCWNRFRFVWFHTNVVFLHLPSSPPPHHRHTASPQERQTGRVTSNKISHHLLKTIELSKFEVLSQLQNANTFSLFQRSSFHTQKKLSSSERIHTTIQHARDTRNRLKNTKVLKRLIECLQHPILSPRLSLAGKATEEGT